MEDPSSQQLLRKQIEALFLAAVELPLDEQAPFIQANTDDDLQLRAQVLSLLQADRQSQSVIGELAEEWNVGSLLQGDEPSELSQVGEQYGNYRVTDLIGSGGMGEVWRARRVDGRFDTEVAIKLLRADQIDGASQARFHREGQLLARLVHPNIARLLDAGVTPDHRAYLVIEFVDGVSIQRYCEQQQLELRDRLLLFLDILDAIAHAHANLVIHRDIKPANILVTADGVVKLLDFGVAALLDDRPSEPAITAVYGSAMTPQYAAPEQLLGAAITTATDTFSLGLVLHLLLAGWHPRTPTNSEPYTLLQAIRHATDELPKLSSLPAKSSISRKVFVGDIDNIIAKAIAPEAADRYPTAIALADDIRRYLRHEPVVAQAPTLTYRMTKFVRRHRGSVASALLAAIALVIATVITTLQSIEAKQQRDIAMYEQRRVQASNEFTSLLFEEMGKDNFTTNDLLDRGAQLLDQQFDPQQDFFGRVLYDVAGRYGTLDERKRQRDLLEKAESAAKQQGDRSLLGAIRCDLAKLLILVEPESAKTHLQAGLTDIHQAQPAATTDRIACLQASSRFADVDGQFDAAEQALLNARELNASNGSVSVTLQATLTTDLAYLYFNNRRNVDALGLLNQVGALYVNSGRGNTRSALKNTSHQSVVLGSTGQLLASQQAFETLLAAYAERDSKNRGIGVTLEQYGITLLRMRQPDLALPPLRRARKLAQQADSEVDMAMADLGLARVLVALNREPEAETHLAVAAELLARNKNVYLDQSNYRPLLQAQIHTLAGELDEASDIVQRHFKKLNYPETLDGTGLASFLVRAIEIAQTRAEFEAAERYSSDLLHISTGFAAEPGNSADVGFALLYRATARKRLNRDAEARLDVELAEKTLTTSLGNTHPETQRARRLGKKFNKG